MTSKLALYVVITIDIVAATKGVIACRLRLAPRRKMGTGANFICNPAGMACPAGHDIPAGLQLMNGSPKSGPVADSRPSQTPTRSPLFVIPCCPAALMRHVNAQTPPGVCRVIDYNTHFVFAAGILTISACLTLHSFFMFMVLQSQVAFRRRFPGAAGVGLVMPSMLIAAVLLVVSTFLQIGLWAVVLWYFGRFEQVQDVVYFSGTTYTTLGTGKHVLVAPYCVLEPMEATNGILVAGLNTAILFAILSSVARRHAGYKDFLR